MTRAYEVLYIVRPLLDEEGVGALVTRLQETIAKLGGNVEKSEKMGRKRLAYEIRHQREGSRDTYKEGFYVLTEFQAEPGHLAEIDRAFKLTDDVVRHLITLRPKQ
jgi:small subunit ribosomal protein S6